MRIDSPIAEGFELFLEKLAEKDLKHHDDISFQIYYDMFRIRAAQWKYKLEANRRIDYSVSDIFQDLIAHYLRLSLPTEYEVVIEAKKGKLRPDILIRKDKIDHAIIEIKTTIGWNRGLVKDREYMTRINQLNKEFRVPIERIFYIFDSYGNVSKEFETVYENDKDHEIKHFIFPLYKRNAAPYYISNEYREFSKEEIYAIYKENCLTHFSKIIKKIQDRK
jgi:hypothetical protein